MIKRKVGVINAPSLDGNLFESGQRFTRDEIESRRRERFHLTWEDQRRLHAEDLEPAGLTAFYAAIQDQMLKLFQFYGIDIPDGAEVTWEQWRQLAILQAIQNRDINIIVEGVPLPVLGDGEEISASNSVRLAQGARHAADRHEHICMIFNQQLASAPIRKNGKPNQTLAAKKTLEVLQKHYPGEYPSGFWKSIRSNHSNPSQNYPIHDATSLYIEKVLAIHRGIRAIAAQLKGSTRKPRTV